MSGVLVAHQDLDDGCRLAVDSYNAETTFLTQIRTSPHESWAMTFKSEHRMSIRHGAVDSDVLPPNWISYTGSI